MEHLLQLLRDNNLTIASCESLTAGLFAASLAEVPHASAALKGGIVSYWTEIKTDVVGVDKETVAKYGVVSGKTAREMAENVQRIFQSDIAVSFTGNAGPEAMEGKPVGLVYTCIRIADRSYVYEDLIVMERNQLRRRIVDLTAERICELIG